MLETEYVRNLNSNYERVLLNKKPETERYQYCILSRGGIRGLLPCSLRFINGMAYLYYDITSTQNVYQLFMTRNISRAWIRDFLWNMKRLQRELARFLLDDTHVIWSPEQIFQDMEKNNFFFMYIPYYEEDSNFLGLLKFWVDHIDYNDEMLVECVYKMYEQFEKLGADYLQDKIYEDASCLEKASSEDTPNKNTQEQEKGVSDSAPSAAGRLEELSSAPHPSAQEAENKKGIRYLFDGRKKRQKNQIDQYRREMFEKMEGYAVSEDNSVQEDYGKTVYMEVQEKQETVMRLYTDSGKLAAEIRKTPFVIGKKMEGVDLALEDASVSRLHARIINEEKEVYLEDLNSTNGTFKNGLRMQPYEKRPLESGDEIRLGKVELIYR